MSDLNDRLRNIAEILNSGGLPDFKRIEHVSSRLERRFRHHGELHPDTRYYLGEIAEGLERNEQISIREKDVIKDRLLLERIETDETIEIDEAKSELEQSIETEDNVVFLFGAGASYASGIPLVKELLTELVEQAKRTQNKEFIDLMRECERNDNIGIEDLLTAVYLAEFAVSEPSTLNLLKSLLFAEKSVPTSGLFSSEQAASESDSPLDGQVETDPASVNFIQDAIQTPFGSIASEMIPEGESQTHSELQRFIENHDKTSVITTNYDYCIEQKLFGEVSVNTVLNSIPADSEHEVDLYKMHGSISWTYCVTCQSTDCVEPEKVKDKFQPNGDTLPFPVKGICHICSGERRPLLVPPTSFKFVQFPPLIDVRAAAKEKLEDADYIIPVGYSFSDEDAYIYKLVWSAMRGNDDAKMIIVDPDARELAGKLQDRFSVQASDFDSDRVVAYTGKSEEVMGDLVDQLLPSESPTKDAETNGAAVEESAE